MDSSQPTADDPRPSPIENINYVTIDKCAVCIIVNSVKCRGCKLEWLVLIHTVYACVTRLICIGSGIHLNRKYHIDFRHIASNVSI